MLKIAIQAKGRLNEKSVALLTDAGISVPGAHRSLMAHASGFPLDVLYLRDDDIPQAVSSGVADIGIVGLNEVEERGLPVDIVLRLGFGSCRISLAIPKNVPYEGIEWFNGKSVATSYPNVLRNYFEKNGIDASIHYIAGSVEVAPTVGMSDAIFDIVSSGGTLVQNGLVEVEKIFWSEAVLIATPGLPEDKRQELDKLVFRFNSIIESREMKYVLFNIPESAVDEAVKIIPGMKSPTLIPLSDKGWYSFQAVIAKDDLWDKIEKMKAIGAQDILVLQVENIVR